MEEGIERVVNLYNRIALSENAKELTLVTQEFSDLCEAKVIYDPILIMTLGNAIQAKLNSIYFEKVYAEITRYKNVKSDKEETDKIEEEKKESLDKVKEDGVISLANWRKNDSD